MRNNKGFSLVELIVVIAIMAILAAVAIPTFATFISKAQQAADVDFMAQVESAAELAFATSDDKVSAIAVTLNENNDIQSMTITVGTEYTFTKQGTDWKHNYTGTNESIKSALTDFIAVVDFDYNFKAGTNAKNSDNWSDAWTIE